MTDEDVNEDTQEVEDGEDGEDSEEAEVSEELMQLADAAASIEEDLARLKALHKKGKLQGEVLGAELTSTILPLLLSLANATVDHASSTEEWGESVDETLDAIEKGVLGDVVGAPSGAGGMSAEDVQLFGWLFSRFKEFLQGALQAPDMAEEMRKGLQEIDGKLDLAAEKLQQFEVEDGQSGSETTEAETDSDSAPEAEST